MYHSGFVQIQRDRFCPQLLTQHLLHQMVLISALLTANKPISQVLPLSVSLKEKRPLKKTKNQTSLAGMSPFGCLQSSLSQPVSSRQPWLTEVLKSKHRAAARIPVCCRNRAGSPLESSSHCRVQRLKAACLGSEPARLLAASLLFLAALCSWEKKHLPSLPLPE